ncbi:MAG: molybdopterin-binding protein [Planctomycetota bacterium]|nr:molybdopterin-binding protein [Planctomycetota bacterium]
MARVEALCTSTAKGDRKKPVTSAAFRAGHGIEGDAHAGPWHRQVSLLAAEDIDAARKGLPDLAPGDFAENVILSGLDLGAMGLGTRLQLGQSAVLSITQIGKVCHSPCRIAQLTGDCLMPRAGLFARVEVSGTVRPGDEAKVLTLVPRSRFQAVILTISDRGARGERVDTAGPAVARQLEAAMDVNIYRTEILPDDAGQIASRLKHYADGHSIDLVVTVGGTGFSPRDVTPEATRSVVERPTPGLDEAMRAASLAKTPHAMLSRGTSGIRGATLIVNLPGSERAARENLEVILPALPHGLAKLRGDPSECGPPRTAGE